MKLVALRMNEEEKARLEQLASERHVTLSTALREGAKLYLEDARGGVHRSKGEPITWLGVRRRKDGRAVDAPHPPTAREATLIRAVHAGLGERGLRSIRESWDAGTSPSVIAAAISQWLQVVGTLYCRQASRWDVFLIDYAEEYGDFEAVGRLRRELVHALTDGVVLNPTTVLDSLSKALDWLIRDLNDHEAVRRNVLTSWSVFQQERDPAEAKRRTAPVAELRAAT